MGTSIRQFSFKPGTVSEMDEQSIPIEGAFATVKHCQYGLRKTHFLENMNLELNV
jgi:hypothetical protein